MNNTSSQPTLIPGKLYCMKQCKLAFVNCGGPTRWIYIPATAVVMFIKKESTSMQSMTRYFIIYKNNTLRFARNSNRNITELLRTI